MRGIANLPVRVGVRVRRRGGRGAWSFDAAITDEPPRRAGVPAMRWGRQ